MFIILTSSQADDVRGPTAPGAALMPIAIQGDLFVLPPEVLTDPDHQMHWEYLKHCPQTDNVTWLVS